MMEKCGAVIKLMHFLCLLFASLLHLPSLQHIVKKLLLLLLAFIVFPAHKKWNSIKIEDFPGAGRNKGNFN
jgi:hypothetical protein